MTADDLSQIVFGPQRVDSVANVRRGMSYGEDISLPMDWTCKGFVNRKNGYAVNGFIFLDKVVKEYLETKDQGLISILKAYVFDWISQNPGFVQGAWAWYDDAIARRVQRMCYYFSKFGDRFGPDELNAFRRSLDMQARVLMDDSHYAFRHNHGMFMDFALMCYALLVCDDQTFREECLDKACGRMLAYFEYAFAEDGVHKEHSPGYAREVSNVAATVSSALASIRPAFAASAQKYGSGSRSWLAALTMPNGFLPAIGDSLAC